MTYTATYSPEDNKLRLYSVSRLDPETYARVKAAGFIWAPKQGLFVAPAWSPGREDLLIELAGEIGDEDTSLVDRAEQRAERFADYSESRAADSDAAHKAVAQICDGIPMGQPILIGHHSERHARKDAEKIENGMRRAVKMWEQTEYWQYRAAGAVSAAKYKERPDVRARRIKGLEADLRKQQRYIADAETFVKLWSASLEYDPEVRRLTVDQAKAIANYDHAGSRCYPLADYPRNPPASQYEGDMGLWSALDGGVITAEQARDIALRSHRATINPNGRCMRWVQHYENRLAYERAMMAESGGTADGKPAAAAFDMQVGGKVFVGRDWYTVTKVNRKAGEVVSVSTNARYHRVMGIELITDYTAPTAEDTAKVQSATKLPPLVNFPSDGCVEMATADWKKYSRWSDTYGTGRITADETHGAYRRRICYRGGERKFIFVTDEKRKDPPPVTAAPAPKMEPVSPTYTPPRVARSLDTLTDAMLEHYESGKLRAGIKYEYSGEGMSECYQYGTVADLIAECRALEAQPRILRYSIVTHSGEYKNMRTVYKWERLADGIETLKAALSAGVQVVSAPQLFPTPPELAARMVEAAGIEHGTRVLEPSAGTGNLIAAIRGASKSAAITAVELSGTLAEGLRARFDIPVKACDFLQCNAIGDAPGDGLGWFDSIVMNPPFGDAADIKHILHAREMLKTGGRLVALCANGPRQQAALKPIAEASGGYYEPLPAGTFAEAGTGVNVALLVIEG